MVSRTEEKLDMTENSKRITQFILLLALLTFLSGCMVAILGLEGGSPGEGRLESLNPVATILLLIYTFSPSIAGIFMTWLAEGGAGVRKLFRRAIQFRLGGGEFTA